MKNDLIVKNGIVIPFDELEITTSRAGGPGGQHVNKSDTRITIRWNVRASRALNDTQKERVLQKLEAQLTQEGDLVISNAFSRSQVQNKKEALKTLVERIKKALYVPKKRMKTGVPKSIKEARLQSKTKRSLIKKMRSKKIRED